MPAQDASLKLYWCCLLRESPIVAEAIVTKVGGKSFFEAYLVHYGQTLQKWVRRAACWLAAAACWLAPPSAARPAAAHARGRGCASPVSYTHTHTLSLTRTHARAHRVEVDKFGLPLISEWAGNAETMTLSLRSSTSTTTNGAPQGGGGRGGGRGGPGAAQGGGGAVRPYTEWLAALPSLANPEGLAPVRFPLEVRTSVGVGPCGGQHKLVQGLQF